MSPMGTLVLGTNSKPQPPEKVSSSSPSSPSSSSSPSHSPNGSSNDHPLLKLMSVSNLLNNDQRPFNLHHSLALTLGKNTKITKNTQKMTLSSNNNSNSGECNQLLQSESASAISPSLESQNSFSRRTLETNSAAASADEEEEDDEVLSIGQEAEQQEQEDQQMVIDSDSSTIVSDCEKRNLDQHQDSSRSSPNNSSTSTSPCSSAGSGSANLSTIFSPLTYSDILLRHHHQTTANYSVTHLLQQQQQQPPKPFSITDALIMKSHQHQAHAQAQQQTFQQQQASLLFSIANILRPDFGLGGANANANAKRPATKSASASALSAKRVCKPIDLSSRPPSLVSGSGQHRGNKVNGSSGAINSNNNHYDRHKSSSESQIALHQEQKKKSHKSPVPLPPITAAATATAGPKKESGDPKDPWPAWVYCTRYSDRPSSGPRTRRSRTAKKEKEIDEKRPRTAFTSEQLARLKREFDENRYLTEKRRVDLAKELRLAENQIKIWFQNKRAKLKKSSGQRGGLALQLMAQGLYNHSTIPRGDGEDDDDDCYDSD